MRSEGRSSAQLSSAQALVSVDSGGTLDSAPPAGFWTGQLAGFELKSQLGEAKGRQGWGSRSETRGAAKSIGRAAH